MARSRKHTRKTLRNRRRKTKKMHRRHRLSGGVGKLDSNRMAQFGNPIKKITTQEDMIKCIEAAKSEKEKEKTYLSVYFYLDDVIKKIDDSKNKQMIINCNGKELTLTTTSSPVQGGIIILWGKVPDEERVEIYSLSQDD